MTSSKGPPPNGRRRLRLVKPAAAALCALLLLIAGQKGRQQAELLRRLDEVTLAQHQLQQKLADEPLSLEAATTHQTPSRKVQESAALLRTRLGQFEADYGSNQLSQIGSLQIALCKAMLADAEGRFSDALSIQTSGDEKHQAGQRQIQNDPWLPFLQVRADSLYGLNRLPEALEIYRQIQASQPHSIATLGHISQCLYRLGRPAEAFAALLELAKSHDRQGLVALIQGRPDRAIEHFEQAIQVQTWLLAQQSSNQLTNDLAMSHQNLGDALLVQEKPGAAVGHYEQAIQMQTSLVKQSNDLTSDLALNQFNLGNALFGQQKLDAAAENYQKAVALLAGLVQSDRSHELAADLAMCKNNLAVVERAQAKAEAAIVDFGQAINLLTRLLEAIGPTGAAAPPNHLAAAEPVRVELNVAIEYGEKSVEVSVRARRAGRPDPRELASAQGLVFKNRGYAYLVQGKADKAVADFSQAADIYARLIAQGQTDLTPQLEKVRSAEGLFKPKRP